MKGKRRSCLWVLLLLWAVLGLGRIATADVIIDNGDQGTSFTGSWGVSGGDSPYGADSLWSRDGATYTWQFADQPPGIYEVLMWWSGYPSRSTAVEVEIAHGSGSERLTINQSQNGGQWNSLGTFSFADSGRVTMTATNGSIVSTCADAVWFRRVQPAEIIIDNLDSRTMRTGLWQVSGAAGAYGEDSVWSRDGATFTWSFVPAVSGEYDLSMWWTEWPSRSSSVPVDIIHADGTSLVHVNQIENGGQWNGLGRYAFQAGVSYTVMITAQPGPASTCADAVRLTLASAGPVAVIDAITPSPALPGESVSFSGHGEGGDGPITGYRWESDRDGVLSGQSSFSTSSLSEGVHVISFFVQNSGGWSASAIEMLTIGTPPAEIIIDNRDPRTTQTGLWQVSGAPEPYGGDSVWSRDGSTFAWSFVPAYSGEYDLAMWWTEWPTRSSSVPVDIAHAGGSSRVYVNQLANGGQWNGLGRYAFQAGVSYTIMMTAQPGPASTCADAVRLTPAASSGLLAVIDTITPNPAAVGEPVSFSGHGEGGAITGYRWESSLDGFLSDLPSFSTSTLSPGSHTISLVVSSDGAASAPANRPLAVEEPVSSSEEHIYFCNIYNGYDSKELLSATMREIGATQVNSALWSYRNQTQGKDYFIHLVENIAGMKTALMTPGAHVITLGHSNYGLGPLFATAEETRNLTVNDLYFIDDDRIFNISSPWIAVSISGMRTGQAYPYWWSNFKDGTSGIMPYELNDPAGDPPYNYYPTYQLPDDSTHYRIETARNTAMMKFFGSGVPAWYAPDGSEPDPRNPEHQQYFITNNSSWEPSFEAVGDWRQSQGVAGYYLENYVYTPAGSGADRVRWLFNVPQAGNYKIYAWWSASDLRTPAAPYTVDHGQGSTTVAVDQRQNGGRWNELGEYYFYADRYSVTLTDNAEAGNVVADAIRVAHVDNPPEVLKADFNARNRYGVAPLEVTFDSESIGEISGILWDFGDGFTNATRTDISHIYNKPGVYTVRLTVYGPLGSDAVTKEEYIHVGQTTPVLQAEFSGDYQVGMVPHTAYFRDRSTGDIASRLWDFGDGGTSTSQNPSHIYTTPGNYTVSLTVTDTSGNQVTETKPHFVRAVIFDRNIDNVDYPKRHYGSKTVLFRKEPELRKEDLRYARFMYNSCNSGNYYLDLFSRGVVFYTVNTSVGRGVFLYLKEYLQGTSDAEIWSIIQDHEPVYDYYDFRKLPSEQ